MGGALDAPQGGVEAARRSPAFCSGRSRSAADDTNRVRSTDTPDTPQMEKTTQTRSKKKKKEGEKSNGGWLVVESVERETTKRMVNVCLLLFMKECVCVHVCVSTSPQAQTGAVEELEKIKMEDFRQKVRKK